METARLIDALRCRLFWMKFGVAYLQTSRFKVKRIKIGKRVVTLSIPSGEEQLMDYEFKTIFYDDCYGLRKIDGKVESILDIGSNLGFFSIAARSRFPGARIHGYEPNPKITKHLANNTKGLSIEMHPEAIGPCEGWIEVETHGGSLFARSVASETGHIKQIAMGTAIERMGGSVDLLKLDCEGAEWGLFEHPEIWKRIKRLTMEYHLWAKPEVDVPEMVEVIRGFGFRITQLSESPERKWGIVHAAR